MKPYRDNLKRQQIEIDRSCLNCCNADGCRRLFWFKDWPSNPSRNAKECPYFDFPIFHSAKVKKYGEDYRGAYEG